MEKCLHCGRSILSTEFIVLKQGWICKQCFADLGFSGLEAIARFCFYEDIKGGREEYEYREAIRQKKALEKISHVYINSGPHDLTCTEEERLIFNNLRLILEGQGFDSSVVKFVRNSKNYLSAELNGLWDILRFKYTIRSKWLCFPVMESSSTRHYIEGPDEVANFKELIIKSMNKALKNK